MNKVIYVFPTVNDIDMSMSSFERLSSEEKLRVAEGTHLMDVMSVEEFQRRFNEGFISDEGFVYFV